MFACGDLIFRPAVGAGKEFFEPCGGFAVCRMIKELAREVKFVPCGKGSPLRLHFAVNIQIAGTHARIFLAMRDGDVLIGYPAEGHDRLVHPSLPDGVFTVAHDAFAVIKKPARTVTEHEGIGGSKARFEGNDLFGLSVLYHIVGVQPHKVVPVRTGKSVIARGGKIVPPGERKDVRGEGAGNGGRFVRRARVGHDDLVGKFLGAGKAAGKDGLFVFDDEADGEFHILQCMTA